MSINGLAGSSARMAELQECIRRCANNQVTVLLQGETGTGKSSVARSIHAQSSRHHEPFVVFDCGAVAPNLVESTLFGHEKGAFTGAHQRHLGALESAGAGTLFIDELPELPSHLQPKLLRALEEREFSRVGSNERISVACRIIAASQADLWTLVTDNKFRRDLYFRLAVFIIDVPALRDHREDLPSIVDTLFSNCGASRTFADLENEQQQYIMTHAWPGNVRQLRNHIERLLVSFAVPVVSASSAKAEVRFNLDLDQPYGDARDSCVQQFERAYLERLMDRANNSVTHAARIGEVNRRYLYQLLKRQGLR